MKKASTSHSWISMIMAGRCPCRLPKLNEHGLKAEFYNNENLSGTPVTTRVDSRTNTNGPQDPMLPMSRNYFSVKWTSEIRPQETSNYTFIVKGDDFRLILDGKTVIDEFKSVHS